MDNYAPPHLNEFASLAEWKHARALYFKNLPRRDRTPQTIETVREVPVETVREVEVERIVYVDREVPVEVVRTEYIERIEEVEIPSFLFDPLESFLSEEQREGETNSATLIRLRREVSNLMALEKDGPLTAEEDARKRHLTSNIQPGD